jgi:hypothetical protein
MQTWLLNALGIGGDFNMSKDVACLFFLILYFITLLMTRILFRTIL